MGRAVVGQHLDNSRCTVCPEATLDCVEHDVADVLPADPGIHQRTLSDDFAVVGVDDKGTADDVAVPAGELEGIRTVSQ